MKLVRFSNYFYGAARYGFSSRQTARDSVQTRRKSRAGSG